MRWDDLEAAILKTEWVAALDVAVAGWQRRRHACLADLVDVIAARCPNGEPIRRTSTIEFHEAWLDRAKGATVLDIEPLMGTLSRSLRIPQQTYWKPGTAPKRYKSWTERVIAVGALPADPRMGAHLLDVLRRAPWGGSYFRDTDVIYDAFLALIGRLGDTRLIAPIEALIDTPAASKQQVREYLAGELPGIVAKIKTAGSTQKVLEPVEIERCERIVDSLGGRVTQSIAKSTSGSGNDDVDEAALIDLVIAEIDDDDPREVLADYWLEKNDPRGQLISLQLKVSRGTATEEDAKAIRALLREHEKTWLEDLALVTKRRIWRRGFLDEIELLQNSAADPKVWESSALSKHLGTVRVIVKGKANETHYRRFLFSPAARALREILVVSKGMLRDLCERSEPSAIVSLELGFMADKKVLASIEASSALPALKRLTVIVTRDHVDKLIALMASFTKTRPLESVIVNPNRWYEGTAELASWLLAIRDSLAHVPSVEICVGVDARVIARRGSENTNTKTTKKKKIRLEIVSDQLFAMRELFTELHNDVEHVLLRVPSDASALTYEDRAEAKRLLAKFSPRSVEMDSAWTEFLADPQKKKPRK